MLFKQLQKMKLVQLLTTKWLAKPIFAASEIGLFNVLARQPKTLEELAEKTKTQPRQLYRLLRALESFGFVIETRDRKYRSNRLSDILKAEEMQAMTGMFQSGWHDNAWNCLATVLKTGADAFELGNGLPAFEYFRKNPNAAEQFSRANYIKTRRINKIVSNFDFSNYNTAADIGGGYGGLILDILQNNPHLHGQIIDLNYLKEEADKSIKNQNLQTRCEFIPGNFFEAVTVKADIYILCNILHDWDDEKAVVILDNCRTAMAENASLLIVEMIIHRCKRRSVSTLMDLEVMIMGNGKERTKSEFEHLIKTAGLNIHNLRKFRNDYYLLECRK